MKLELELQALSKVYQDMRRNEYTMTYLQNILNANHFSDEVWKGRGKDAYIKVKRFDQNTTQHDAEAALQAAGVEYTVKQVYNSPAAAGCVADFDFTGYSDSDYYYISGTRTPELSISGGGAQQPADTPKEPARDPEPDKPAGKATLSITSRPNKTSYYIGDKLNTAGLTARYTDASGKAQTITSGFTTNVDMTSAGAKQVTVTYRDASSTFSISVKEPSVTVTQEELNEGLRLYATTDPAGQDVTWSSSNPSVAYFEGKTLHAAGSGTAVISATMTYNGRKYSGSTTVVVGDRIDKEDPVDYSFKIFCSEDGDMNFYSVTSNIPNFSAANVTWSATANSNYWYAAYGGAYVNAFIDCTITASYVYNGRTFTDSFTQMGRAITPVEPQYTFSIEKADGGDYAAYTVVTDIPGFSSGNVIWSVSPADTDWFKEGAAVYIYVIKNATCTITASYTYNGKTYTCTVYQN